MVAITKGIGRVSQRGQLNVLRRGLQCFQQASAEGKLLC